jgi:hypothetical protein
MFQGHDPRLQHGIFDKRRRERVSRSSQTHDVHHGQHERQRVGLGRRRQNIHQEPGTLPSRSPRCRRLVQRSTRPNHPVHQVRPSSQKDGRRKGLVQGWRNAPQHQLGSDEPNAAANIASHRSKDFESDGRHERPPEHDATIPGRWRHGRFGQNVWWNGRPWRSALKLLNPSSFRIFFANDSFLSLFVVVLSFFHSLFGNNPNKYYY